MRINFQPEPRTCGDCTLCCKVLGVEELGKPPHVYCTHASKKNGCEIYETRPETCRTFRCLWLDGSWPDWAKPNKIHGVLGPTDNGENLILWEDSGYPGVASAHLKDIFKKLISAGQIIIVACGKKRTLLGNRKAVIQEIESWKENVQSKETIHNP